MTTLHLKRLCIIGVGLIGGSLARALRKADAVDVIVGAGRNEAHLQRAKQLGIINEFSIDIPQAVRQADMVVIAVPLGAMQAVLQDLRPCIDQISVITDVGSAKQSVIEAAQRVFGRVPTHLVPGHPIAGTEKSGVEASFAELFTQRRVILTPLQDTRAEALHAVRAMWECCGARVQDMDPIHHDDVLAATSHLPHMLAYTLVDSLARMQDRQEIFTYAAGGFRDFTRIASSDPQMWHDVCLANRTALAKVLGTYALDLQRLCDAIQRGDSDYLYQIFKRAKQARDQFCE